MATQSSPIVQSDLVDIDEAAQPLLDDFARSCVHQLGEWAHAHAADYGLRFENVRARRWQSIEDPDWVQVVIDITVAGDTEAAFRFWDAAIDNLVALTEPRPDLMLDLFSTSVHWR
ncbi:MAG: hypothetical protein ACRDI2_15690 [Chloroflexota bacterium]